MLFSSLSFLVWFLPAVVLIHMALPVKARNAFLLGASIFFYAWGEIAYLPLVLVSMALNYGFGRLAADRRASMRLLGLWASLLVNIGALLYFKYAAFLLEAIGLGAIAPEVSLPLGISFYTFQTQAYVIDVYRGRVPPEKKPVDYATFILLFPQLIAGPIVLYTDVRLELKARELPARSLESGMLAFIAGLASKVALANPLGALWENVSVLKTPSMAAAWLGIIAFGLQIYFDFAGYSMMAIGMGRMLGFRFPENFRDPYASRSIREFWRRWHMTLGGWFREYVYFPLGGSRGSAARTVLNLVAVWALTGLWHGASWNFVAWGLWFCLILVLERFLIGKWLLRHQVLSRVYTLLVVFLGWALFAHDSLSMGFAYILRMFSFSSGMDWQFLLRGNAVLLVVSALCCVPWVLRKARLLLWRHTALRLALGLGALALCIAGLVLAAYNPFLYFRF